jgi:hypothetical protein
MKISRSLDVGCLRSRLEGNSRGGYGGGAWASGDLLMMKYQDAAKTEVRMLPYYVGT